MLKCPWNMASAETEQFFFGGGGVEHWFSVASKKTCDQFWTELFEFAVPIYSSMKALQILMIFWIRKKKQ